MPNEEVMAPDGKKQSRGRTSPGYTLRECVDWLKRIHVALGGSPASRETIAEALGHSSMSGTAALKVGALTHFGLLDGRGNSYTISSIGFQIVMPTIAGEAENAIAQAAKNPTLYGELVAEFSGKALPQMLGNLLHRKYNVASKSSEEVAQKFRDTMEFSGLLRNGIQFSDLAVSSAPSQPNTDNTSPQQNRSSSHIDNSPPHDQFLNRSLPGTGSNLQQYTIPLGKSGRVAAIQLPIPVLASDLKKLQSWLSFMETVLQEDPENLDPTDSKD